MALVNPVTGETTAVDGVDLGLRPVNFRADPIEHTAKASGLMGNVHWVWPNARRAKLLTLDYDDLDTDQVRTLIAALGPRTGYNRILSVNLGTTPKHYIVPGGVSLRASGVGGRWRLEAESYAVEYDELGGHSVEQITEIHANTMHFAVYRYGHLYVAHDNGVTVMDPNRSTTFHPLTFTPTTWASYGGLVALYNPGVAPAGGGAKFIGSALSDTTLATSGNTITAPYAVLHNGPAPSDDSDAGYDTLELNGMNYRKAGTNIWVFDALRTTFYEQPIVTAFEENEHLILFADRNRFSFFNGITGKLLYTDPAATMVPYVYSKQGILAVGVPDGYYFSPDMGISWRKRKLPGFGVMTEKGILSVSNARGIEVIEGSW